MRTTVDLPDELLRQARITAAREGTTLTALLADGLRLRLGHGRGVARSTRPLPVSKTGGGLCSLGSTPPPTPPCSTPQTATLLLPDVNVVLAAFRADHVHHAPVRAFLDTARCGDKPLGLSPSVLSAVVRLATNPRVFAHPDTTDAVLDFLDVLLDEPAQIVGEGERHWPRFCALCRALQLRGNLVPDAHLAALALERHAELVTWGFGRYPRLRWRCLLDD